MFTLILDLTIKVKGGNQPHPTPLPPLVIYIVQLDIDFGFDDWTFPGEGGGDTKGLDMTLNLKQVFVNFVHQHGQIYTGMGTLVPDKAIWRNPDLTGFS